MFGLRVTGDIEHFNFTPPDGLAVHLFMHRHGASVHRGTLVPLFDRPSEPLNCFLFARHKVRWFWSPRVLEHRFLSGVDRDPERHKKLTGTKVARN
jgi:hypothetical protein